LTPLPAGLGSLELVAWRLDDARFAATWNSGEGAYKFGGRWSSRGVRAVYCSVDPSTTILEVAVHKRFRILDTQPHVLTALTVTNPAKVHVVLPGNIPNPHWLRPGSPSAGQQAFGDTMLTAHGMILVPSAVSTHSWNLVFDADKASGDYLLKLQEPFALDTRLHPPI
jgi:RES domain-containing protein